MSNAANAAPGGYVPRSLRSPTPRVLVLGPMPKPGSEDEAKFGVVALARLVRTIGAAIAASDLAGGGATVGDIDQPREYESNRPAPDIIRRIEAADLVVIDLTGSRPAVIYELGIVHALGVPHMLLTTDRDQSGFYLRESNIIRCPQFYGEFDQTRDGHAKLFDRLREFLSLDDRDLYHSDSRKTYEDRLAKFCDNPITQHFSLPLVEISVPTGLAAGYWRNFVQRFFRDGGYIGDPQPVKWSPRASPPAQGDGSFRIRRFITILPPSLTLDMPPASDDSVAHARDGKDLAVIAAELDRLGLCLFDGTLPPDNMRTTGAKFLGRKTEGAPWRLIEPAIVVDVPTTLYVLEDAPRFTVEDRPPVRQRRLDEMIVRFENRVRAHIQKSGNTEQHRFALVRLGQLPDLLRELGVLAG